MLLFITLDGQLQRVLNNAYSSLAFGSLAQNIKENYPGRRKELSGTGQLAGTYDFALPLLSPPGQS